MIEDELRDAFARHEAQAPALEPLRRGIAALAARRRRARTVRRAGAVAVVAALGLLLPPLALRDGLPAPIDGLVGTESPVVAPDGALNLLLLGIDPYPGPPDPGRTDTVLLVHLPADRRQAYLVSLPRDLQVDIPGHGQGRLNAAYFHGGARLAEQVVERLTGVPVDAVAAVRLNAVRRITDLLGGVRVCLPETVLSIHTSTRYAAGCHDLDGRRVADLLRQRQGLAMGAYERDRNAQRVLIGLATRAAELELFRDAGQIMDLVRTPGLTVDTHDVSALGLAGRWAEVESGQITGIGQPSYHSATTDGTHYERLDPVDGPQLFAALRDDTMAAFAAAHPDWVLRQE